MCVCVYMCVCLSNEQASEPIKPKTKGAPQRGGDTAEDQKWWRRLSLGAQDLPGLCTLSQKAFSDLPTKFEARHQYFPASFSVTLDSFNLLWASVCLLTTLCKGKIERHSEAFIANSCKNTCIEHTCKPWERTHTLIYCQQERYFLIFILSLFHSYK